MLKVKGVKIDLSGFVPFLETNNLLDELTGKSRDKAGVYMFIHKNTDHKYVGSSNFLDVE